MDVAKKFSIAHFYIDNGRSILRFFFLASVTCFAIVTHTSNNKLALTKMNASFRFVKYNETTEKIRSAKITSSHITKMTTSALVAVDVRLEVEEKKETEAQSCFDRI